VASNFITDGDLLRLVTDALQLRDVAEIQGYWTRRCEESNRWAQGHITGALAARGYTATQAAGCDRAREWNESLGKYHALKGGRGVFTQQNSDPLEIYDCRKELETAAVTVGGVVVTPGGSAYGRTAAGMLDAAWCKPGRQYPREGTAYGGRSFDDCCEPCLPAGTLTDEAGRPLTG
jgi:hypothetical protein